MVTTEYGKGYIGSFNWEVSTTTPEPDFPGDIPKQTAETPTSLKGLRLNTFDTVTAEFKLLAGNTVDTRCASVASILGVSGQELTKLVWSYCGKVANDGNKWSNREDCESTIYRKLLASKGKIQGEWGLVCQTVRWAFQSWWQAYKANRNVNELTAISLDRAKFDEDSENGTLDLPSTVDLTGAIHASIDTNLILDSLTSPLREVLAKRLTDTPLTDAERKRWSRFIAHKANVSTLLGLMNGTLEGKPKWIRSRGKAETRIAAPERSKSGPVIVIQKPSE